MEHNRKIEPEEEEPPLTGWANYWDAAGPTWIALLLVALLYLGPWGPKF